ncbi:MAG: PD-(D/E)XK nuclease family protein, partial [Bacteroidia bacterium]
VFYERVDELLSEIYKHNISFVSDAFIYNGLKDNPGLAANLVLPAKNALSGLENIKALVVNLINKKTEKDLHQISVLELEYLSVILESLNRMSETVQSYSHFDTFKSLRQLFYQTVAQASVPFVGEPLLGLQILGVLETRTLDFENIIMVGVNEGVLPAGRSNNSFLPNDLKRYVGLPLYEEKDAIYAYHFYRLLQRAKQVHLIYDSETDDFGKGEKSRFITQLQYELKEYSPEANIHESIAVSETPQLTEKHFTFENETNSITQLEKRYHPETGSGLSASAVNVFKNCSLQFYFRYVLGIKAKETVEESADAGTFGTILHDSLETLYRPLIDKNLNPEDFNVLKSSIDEAVYDAFQKSFGKGVSLKGKNYLQYEVIKRYVERMINADAITAKESIKKKEVFKLIDLESKWEVILPLPEKEIKLVGKIDRIDMMGDKIRILDYKSSLSDKDKLEFSGFEDLFENTKKDKVLQLFFYLYLVAKNKPDWMSRLEPGIISFKTKTLKPKGIVSGKEAGYEVNELAMQAFEERLQEFVNQLLSEQTVFSQTEDERTCTYCDYKQICLKD